VSALDISIRKNTAPTAWQRVSAARAAARPTAQTFIRELCTEFHEMHGDRRFGDDGALICGIARLCGTPVTVIGIEKGRDVKEKARRNFGSAHPEGYRKALRQMRLAEKFSRPVLCLIDTSGAYCGLGAEERGQGQAIAENLMEMMTLRTPILSVLIGEGGSGGALALAVADEVWMLENAVYSVISPEGCASILWKDSSKVKQASECLRLTAKDLLGLGVIERVLPEDGALFPTLREDAAKLFGELKGKETGELLEARYKRFRAMGEWV